VFWELKESQAEVEVELQVETEITTEGLGQGPEIDEVGVETDITEDGAEAEIGEDPEAEIVDEEAEVVEDPEAGEGAELDLGTDVVMIESPKKEIRMIRRMERKNLQLKRNLLRMVIQKMVHLKLLKRRNQDLEVVNGKGPNPGTGVDQDPDPGRDPSDQDLGTDEDVPEAGTGDEVGANLEGEADPEITRARSPREIGEVLTEMTGKRSEEIMIKKNKVLRIRKKRNTKLLTWRYQILLKITL